ncbi:MAG: hypothetical protein KIG62_00685, partial [Oscillospiraceae bacterium]|nr:hypothetical protein [Oscillospiraceae bacterium]
MNNTELTAKVKSYLKGSAAKAKKYEDLVAVSISLLSENTEDMYVAVRDGAILVAPYRYDDNNCSIEATAETIDKLFSGAITFDAALEGGFVKVVSGDVAKFKALEALVGGKKAPAKKEAAKKAPAKKAAAKKALAKKAAAKPVETK